MRGFNQSSLIAGQLASRLKISISNNYLIRHKYAKPQILLDAKDRHLAVKDAFRVKGKKQFNHVALVDDVVTTTNTVNQAAKALKRSGTKKVSVWSIARNT